MPKTFNGSDVAGAPTADGVTGDSLGDHDGTIQHGYDYSDPPFAANLLRYYPGDENSGTVATDYSGNNADGTYDGPTLNGDTFLSDGVATYDGNNDVLDAADLPTLSEFTIFSWFYPLGTGGARVIYRGYGNNGFLMRVNSGNFQVGLHDGLGFESRSTPISTDQWYSGALSWDGSLIRCYLNGGQFDDLTVTNNNDTFGQTDTIGIKNDGNQPFFGTICHTMAFDTQLSDAGIQYLHDIGLQGNLVTGWI